MRPLPSPDRVVVAFERGEMILPKLDHSGHVYLAWCYLRALPLLDAVACLPRAIRQFAEDRGDPDNYNTTLTLAYLLLIHQRMQNRPEAGWEHFRRENPDLFTWPEGPVSERYSPERLRSPEAKLEFVPPDRPRG